MELYDFGCMPQNAEPLPELPPGYQGWVNRTPVSAKPPEPDPEFDTKHPYIDEVMRCKWG